MVAKSKQDVAGLRRANQATARLLKELAWLAQPGVTTGSLNRFAEAEIQRLGGEAVFHTQNGFPGCINTSVNDEAVHGVPGGRTLQAGDLLKIDCGLRLGSYCGDTTITIGVGDQAALSAERRAVLAVTREALRRGIRAVRVGGRVGDIGHAIQTYVEAHGLQVLRQFTGHGLGHRLWEEPSIPAFGRAGSGPGIVEGMVFTIEPIVVAGSGRVYTSADGWTVRTVDRSPAAQFEHTVMASRHGTQILSQLAAVA
ncbi:MAG TPA: type I methionyl aminopeptidase [Steroidobacteraceae bacterium]|jgi:methionyl aminopeptidase|nr:type I methionyl aminopeptidase [Steroidobacteraceae bacterium]